VIFPVGFGKSRKKADFCHIFRLAADQEEEKGVAGSKPRLLLDMFRQYGKSNRTQGGRKRARNARAARLKNKNSAWGFNWNSAVNKNALRKNEILDGGKI
jgi:hypothetical protein